MRNAAAAEGVWRHRLTGLVVLLCFVVGLIGSPVCVQVQAQGASLRSTVAMTMPASHGSADAPCADPCCKQHSRPSSPGRQSGDCVVHCEALAPVALADFQFSVTQVLYSPLTAAADVDLVALEIGHTHPFAPDPSRSLPFAAPLRI